MVAYEGGDSPFSNRSRGNSSRRAVYPGRWISLILGERMIFLIGKNSDECSRGVIFEVEESLSRLVAHLPLVVWGWGILL
jgi:hypothetical protein